MKVSELTTEIIAEYVHIGADDPLLESCRKAAVDYAAKYTGHTEAELDDYEDITLAVLALISDLYDQRSMTIDKGVVNRTTTGILDLHAINLLPSTESEEDEEGEE